MRFATKKRAPCGARLVAGRGFEPTDLRVMSPTSYRTAPPRDIESLIIIARSQLSVNTFFIAGSAVLRVSLNAEETVTVFPALFFYPKAGGRRLKH